MGAGVVPLPRARELRATRSSESSYEQAHRHADDMRARAAKRLATTEQAHRHAESLLSAASDDLRARAAKRLAKSLEKNESGGPIAGRRILRSQSRGYSRTT
jgi:hypothetical protein